MKFNLSFLLHLSADARKSGFFSGIYTKEKTNYIEIILYCFHVIPFKSRNICFLYLE